MINKVKSVYVPDYGMVLYSDAAMKVIFKEIVKLCFDTNSFDRETAIQSDDFLIKCQEVMPNIVDMIGFQIDSQE